MNIIDDKGADPWVFKQNDYLYCKTTGYDTEISIAQSESLQGIGAACLRVVASSQNLPADASKEIWAPELHKLDDRWYIYFAASDGVNESHRMHVIQTIDDDPLGVYEYAGKLSVEDDRWAIDGTVMNVEGKKYFIWSGWEGDTNGQQNLYIAEMTSPVKLEEARVCISQPDYGWERNGMPINEGPAVLYHESDIFVAYSASASWTDDYCIGIMKLVGPNPLDYKDWEKQQEPFYSSRDEEFGPGHCSFTKDEHEEDVMVYHTARHSGSGWDRQIRYVPVVWDEGRPVAKASQDHLLV